jgi:hypothetical protein
MASLSAKFGNQDPSTKKQKVTLFSDLKRNVEEGKVVYVEQDGQCVQHACRRMIIQFN